MFPVEAFQKTIGKFLAIAEPIGLPLVQVRSLVPMCTLVRFLVACALWMVTSFPLVAQIASDSREAIFDLQRLSKPPAASHAVDIPSQGVHAIFFEGVPYRGKPTKVFAYYGLPSRDSQSQGTEKVPGVVLIHGGGGTAFANWVKL
jgi:hypothetical protein